MATARRGLGPKSRHQDERHIVVRETRIGGDAYAALSIEPLPDATGGRGDRLCLGQQLLIRHAADARADSSLDQRRQTDDDGQIVRGGEVIR